jgi:hypothetical protein
MTGDSDINDDESTAETMLREAMEYLELYYHERSEDMSYERNKRISTQGGKDGSSEESYPRDCDV